MTARERAVVFGAANKGLTGVLHIPEYLATSLGVVIVVGGPQYRVGSHRQFVLLARALADRGIPVLRFDYSGMGDSAGESTQFDQSGPDIRAAIDFMFEQVRGLTDICLWGLCDAASAALMYVTGDHRVSRMVLLNPWVRTESGLAKAYLDNYYGHRLRSASFWRKVMSNPFTLVRSAGGYLVTVLKARGSSEANSDEENPNDGFLDRMLDGARAFRGPMLILLSGRDTVAAEFEVIQETRVSWRRAFRLDNVAVRRLEAADHTFSKREWRDWVAKETAVFLLAEPKS